MKGDIVTMIDTPETRERIETLIHECLSIDETCRGGWYAKPKPIITGVDDLVDGIIKLIDILREEELWQYYTKADDSILR